MSLKIFNQNTDPTTLANPGDLWVDTSAGTPPYTLRRRNAGGTGWDAVTGAPTLPGLTSGHLWVGNGSGVATDVALTGDATLSNTGALTLANSGVTAGTYGDATHVPVIIVNAKGLITGVSSVVIAAMSNPMTAPGDLIVGGTAGAPGRLAVGASDGLVLVVSSSLPDWGIAGVNGGGTGTDLSGAGPGVVVQGTLGAALSVEAQLELALGGTGADLSAAGPGVVVQASGGAAFTVVSPYATTGSTAGFTAGGGTAVTDDSTWAGTTGGTAYTIDDIVDALKAAFILGA